MDSGVNTWLRREKLRLASLSQSPPEGSRTNVQRPSPSFPAPKRKSLWRIVFISAVIVAETGLVFPICLFPSQGVSSFE